MTEPQSPEEHGPDERWPDAELSRIARLHVLAAGLPGTIVEERTFARPFDETWAWVGDLSRSVPVFDRTVARLDLEPVAPGRYIGRARSSWRMAGLPQTFDIDLEPGWCWMVGRAGIYVVGMAAEPDGPDRTRFAHLEGVPGRLGRWFAPVARASRRRHVGSDLAGMRAHLEG